MANGKELATYNEKALSFKAYLGNENIKKQIMDAAPRMLNGERFLKVFYGAILRNPKLLDCTTESMLQAAMFFAQLGLEPILGRAYLVPYLNSKNVDGRWVKQYEVQAQIGYQGLVDLARRSGTISDVWGSSVYENDIFDLSYGMQRDLIHKPWFMDPVKRKAAAGAGEFLGAYCVWQLKDGTKHPEFMPATEIWKRRAKSQAYTYAETGDPAKGGGKKDSIWHIYNDEMALKTVLKHSSKLVPASIEFLEAVSMDDDRDNSMGSSTMFGGTALQLPEPGPGDLPAIFDAAALDQGVDPNTLQAFIHFVKVTAEGNKMAVDDFKTKVINEKHFDKLWGVFLTTLPSKAPDTTKAPRTRRTKAEIEAEKAAAAAAQQQEQAPEPPPPAPPAPPPTALNGNPIEHTEEWGVMADLKRNNQQGYLQAKIDLKIPQGPRTLDDVNAIIRYLETAMRSPGQEG